MAEQCLLGPEFYQYFYAKYARRCREVRKIFGRPLTFAEKVLFTHTNEVSPKFKRGEDTLIFTPDRVAMQDATAQMAVLQFMTAGLDTVQVPTSIHCDHLVRAEQGDKEDLALALEENREVYDFLQSAACRYGMGFWRPGAGIIHQVVFEQFAFPAGMMVGTDSHTPNAGGMGMIAVGVGGADAVDVMAGLPWGLLNPKIIGVKLTGKLQSWTSAKDVILRIAGMLKVKGGTGAVIEYFGSGTESLSATGRATIANMGAELGATASIFPYNQNVKTYLKKTERSFIAEYADEVYEELRADKEVEETPEEFFDKVIEINLDELLPQWVGPHSPDLLHQITDIPDFITKEDIPDEISAALIGSCTNSSYEDISRAAKAAQQALEHGLKLSCPLFVTPGSDQVYATVERDGLLEPLLKLGAKVLAHACGPCIGQWKRNDDTAGKKNTIVTSYNRNFRKRNDGNENTFNFIGSPELVTMAAVAGRLSFNPLTDCIKSDTGKECRFEMPEVPPLPEDDFKIDRSGYVPPISDVGVRRKVEVKIDPQSERLARLEPFKVWQIEDFKNLRLLVKVKGKCTTDHISQAGPWLKYRGHLPNISRNMLLGGVNAFNDQVGTVKNVLTSQDKQSIPEVAEYYKQHGVGWIIVGDENYGEGSSREHAAMEPRYLGCRAVIAKSFARIHETNLKKQGLLPLTFEDPADYDLIKEDDVFNLLGIAELAENSQLVLESSSYQIKLKHSLTSAQIAWFKAGSALNSVNIRS